MTFVYTQDDIARNISVYREQANLARKWAAERRRAAEAEDQVAARLDAQADKLAALLSKPVVIEGAVA